MAVEIETENHISVPRNKKHVIIPIFFLTQNIRFGKCLYFCGINNLLLIFKTLQSVPIYFISNLKYFLMINPKYQIFRDTEDGHFYYRLIDANGEIVLNSEGYFNKQSCLEDISSVRKNARYDSRFDRKDNFFSHAFQLKTDDDKTLGVSEHYVDPNSREQGIYAVKRDGITAPIEDLS